MLKEEVVKYFKRVQHKWLRNTERPTAEFPESDISFQTSIFPNTSENTDHHAGHVGH
jgi:hypothetical protein